MNAARDVVPVEQPEERPVMRFPALEMVGYCRHCGAEVTAQRFAEFQACNRCSSGIGWQECD
jgi:hypothetical protein